MTSLWLLPCALAAWLAALRWPGWPSRPLRLVQATVLPAFLVGGAAALGLCIDTYARQSVLQHLIHQDTPLAPIGAWLSSPRLISDVLLAAPLLAVLATESAWPGVLRPARLLAAGQSISRAAGQKVAAAWPVLVLLPLCAGWADVLATTAGAPGQALYATLERLAPISLSPLSPEPDWRLPALGWWLAACVLALRARNVLPRTWDRLLLAVPILAGALAALWRPAAVTAAVPAFVVMAIVVCALSWRRGAGLADALERSLLYGMLALTLALRWNERLLLPPSSDANGYFNAARDFYARMAELGTNPLALAYLNVHPAGREPLFILSARITFDVLGVSLLHQRYVAIAAAVAGVWATYLFGRHALGRVAGLGAAGLLAVESWHIFANQDGLREGLALLFVYALAALVAARPGTAWVPGAGTAVCAGLLAAGAVLTRLDAGAVVAFLLLAWGVALKGAWRRSLVAGWVFGALVAPLLLGYWLRTGEALAPMGSTMGDDIQASMGALLGGHFPPSEIVRYLVYGTAHLYAGTIFGEDAQSLAVAAGALHLPFADLLRLPVMALLVGGFVAGLVLLVVQGRRLPVALAVLGAYVPPFAFLAGIEALGGPGGGYADRYTYLVAPAAMAVASWALGCAAGALVSLARAAWLGSERAGVSPTYGEPAA